MPNDRDERSKNFTKRIIREDGRGRPEAIDLEETKRASTAREVTSQHKSPEVEVRDKPRQSSYEDEQSASLGQKAMFSGEVIWLRIKMFGTRTVQFAGLYLIFAGLLDIFTPSLVGSGVIESIPEWMLAAYHGLGVSPILSVIGGMFIVWFSTSVWFW